MLEWIRSKVGGYPHVTIGDDFAASFQNGMALCALVHAYDASLIEYGQLDPARHLDNIALGMALAEQYLGVPQMMEPGDVAEADDKLMMVYLYEFPKAFLAKVQSAQSEVGEADDSRAREEEERRRREAEEADRRLRLEAEEAERRRREAEEADRRFRLEAEEAERRRREAEEAERRRREAEEAERRRQEDEERRRREAAAEAEVRMLSFFFFFYSFFFCPLTCSLQRRRLEAEEAERRRLEEEARRRAAEEEEMRRRAEMDRLRREQEEELERMRIFNQNQVRPLLKRSCFVPLLTRKVCSRCTRQCRSTRRSLSTPRSTRRSRSIPHR